MKNKIDITIGEPCTADWNKMSPDQEGRFCSLCNKTVVDFSKMSVEEIKFYFKNKNGKSTCGHFYKNQLDNNHSVYQDNLLSKYRKVKQTIRNKTIRAAALFVLGLMLSLSGCNSHKEEEQVDGKIAPVPSDTVTTLGMVVDLPDSVFQSADTSKKK